jgi:hypothetical protein
MKRLFICLGMAMAVATGHCADSSRQLDKANVLPLALNDDFQFRKSQLFLNDPKTFKITDDPMIRFERERINFKAVSQVDRQQRYGNYFTFSWRAARKGDITVRLEYRQENLGPYVMAKEVFYKDVKGSVKTEFKVVGDDYLQDGRVVAWRALLIENGRIVGLTQSNLWD